MPVCEECDVWTEFLQFAAQKCSSAAFDNWLAPVEVLEWDGSELTVQVPNIFVQEYLLDNYRQDLAAFLPVRSSGEPAIRFIIAEPKARVSQAQTTETYVSPEASGASFQEEEPAHQMQLNPNYRFDSYIEGPSNQFVKSAALGVAARPGRSYNPLFIHGGVGLGKTHLLHAVCHYVKEHHPKLRVQCITTEAFINDLVGSLRNKSVERVKRYYRSLDLLAVDDIQFLQNRLNFEEEFCNMFETLINQSKQVVVTSDKPPGQLKLSERMVARMEWGLVASVNVPDLETRVAILLHKAEQKGLKIPQSVAFFIAEHIFNNVRQLEGAINRLSAHCRLLNRNITEELVERTLSELLQHAPKDKITVEQVLKAVATIFQVGVPALKGSARTKEIALSRQVAMYLAREMVNESLMMIAASFGKKRHSTIIHACQQIKKRLQVDEILRRRVDMVRRNIEAI